MIMNPGSSKEACLYESHFQLRLQTEAAKYHEVWTGLVTAKAEGHKGKAEGREELQTRPWLTSVWAPEGPQLETVAKDN